MAREFTQGFYGRRSWRKLATYYKKKKIYCERCMRNGEIRVGEIVHHKIHLSPENYRDPDIALNEDNLELLCRDCHALEHTKQGRGRWRIDKEGNFIIREN